MPGPVFLHGDSVTLHPVEEEDLDFLQEAVNDPAVRVPLGSSDPRNARQQEERFENDDDEGTELLVAADGERVGKISSFFQQELHGHSYLGCWIHADYHGQGYGSDATATFADYLFRERRCRTLAAHVHAFNDASMGCLESVGFERVGTLPDWVYLDGEHHDTHLYALQERDLNR